MKTNLTRSFISHIRFNFALVGLLSISFFGSASAQSEESDTIELAPCKVTAEVSHYRILVPTSIHYDGVSLEVRDGITTLQLVHSADSQLHVEETETGRWVHVADSQKTLLLSFGPATMGGPTHDAWEAAIETLSA